MRAPFAIVSALVALGACQREEAPERGAGKDAIALTRAPAAPVPLPPVTGAADPTRPLVVIDPGHGGRDPGASSPEGGLREKDVTLAVARAIRDSLADSARVRVAMTRDADLYLGLEDRVRIAERLGASLFISVHADAAGRPEASGATVYTLSEVASDAQAARLAARENAGLATGAAPGLGPGVNHILVDLAQRESMEASAGFARLLHREASPLIAFQPDYHRFAALVVLQAPGIPSVLFEAGYLTNARDAAFLRSDEGRQRIAQGVSRAVETHLARRTARAAGS